MAARGLPHLLCYRKYSRCSWGTVILSQAAGRRWPRPGFQSAQRASPNPTAIPLTTPPSAAQGSLLCPLQLLRGKLAPEPGTTPKSHWSQAPSAAPSAPECPIPFPPGPNPAISVPGVALGEGRFQSVLARDLCSNKILLRTAAHSASQGGTENPSWGLYFYLASLPGVPIVCMSG